MRREAWATAAGQWGQLCSRPVLPIRVDQACRRTRIAPRPSHAQQHDPAGAGAAHESFQDHQTLRRPACCSAKFYDLCAAADVASAESMKGQLGKGTGSIPADS